MSELYNSYLGKGEPHGYCMIHVELNDAGQPVDWVFLTANEELGRIEGVALDQLIGQKFYELFPDGDSKWLHYYYQAAYEGKSVSFDDISEEIGLYLHIEAYPTDKVGVCGVLICDIKKNVFAKMKQEEEREALLKAFEDEKKRNVQIRQYAEAMDIVYPLVIGIDYTNDHYGMIEYDNFLNKTAAYSGTVDELIRAGVSTIPDPKEAEAFWKLFNREAAMKAFRAGKKELVLRHSQYGDDGRIHYMDTHVICTECTDERITSISMSKCIDDEAERERVLQQSAEHAEIIGALATIYTTIMEADLQTHGFKIIQTSSPMKTVVGGKDDGNFDEVMEAVLKYYMIPNDIDRMRKFIDLSTVAERLGSKTTLVTQYKAPYGKWFEARFIAKSRDEEGRVTSAIYAARDITPEKEKELRYQAQLHEQLLVSNTLARNFKNVYLVDLEKETAKILKMDAAFDEMIDEGMGHEFPFAVLLHDWLTNVVHPEDREKASKVFDVETARKVLTEQNEFTGTYRSDANGETHYFQYSMSRAEEDGFKAILGFQLVDDIIQAQLEEEKKRREIEKAYNDRLKAAAAEAEKANKAKTEFLLRMSHDIRTPLNGIRGMLDIAEHYDGDIDKQRECRAKVRESSNILLELINEVLDMSKLESGEIVLEHVPFNLNNMAFEIFTVVEKQAAEQGVEIVENTSLEHTKFIGSPIHFKRLILNILGNSIKYNRPHGKVYITCSEEPIDEKKIMLETEIRDTGIGMSEEFQKHLFEPFRQENASARTKYGGTGLGLSIAKSLAEKMGGTITCESEQGVGTTFTIRIPLELDFSEKAAEVTETAEGASIAGETLLLAEDNDLNLEIAQFILTEAGAKVVAARDGKEALDTFAASKPGEFSAILMDLMMPVMDGYEATHRIRALAREDATQIPIIAMTANAFAEDRIATKKAGMNAHIAKPLDTKIVIRVIAEEIKAAKRQ